MVSMPESDYRSRLPDGATDTNELEADEGDDEMRDSEGVLKNPIGPRDDDDEEIAPPPHQTTTDPVRERRERQRTTTAQSDEPAPEDDAMDNGTDTNPNEHNEPADTYRPDNDAGSGAQQPRRTTRARGKGRHTPRR